MREMEELLESRSNPEHMEKAMSVGDIHIDAKQSKLKHATETAKKWYKKASSIVLVTAK